MRIIMEYPWIFIFILIFLAILLLFCLIRAIKGPTIADRVVAVNMMGTIVMVSIAMLAVYMDESYLLDICLIYAMISFLAVVVLTKIYSGVYLEKLAKDRKLPPQSSQVGKGQSHAMKRTILSKESTESKESKSTFIKETIMEEGSGRL